MTFLRTKFILLCLCVEYDHYCRILYHITIYIQNSWILLIYVGVRNGLVMAENVWNVHICCAAEYIALGCGLCRLEWITYIILPALALAKPIADE